MCRTEKCIHCIVLITLYSFPLYHRYLLSGYLLNTPTLFQPSVAPCAAVCLARKPPQSSDPIASCRATPFHGSHYRILYYSFLFISFHIISQIPFRLIEFLRSFSSHLSFLIPTPLLSLHFRQSTFSGKRFYNTDTLSLLHLQPSPSFTAAPSEQRFVPFHHASLHIPLPAFLPTPVDIKV